MLRALTPWRDRPTYLNDFFGRMEGDMEELMGRLMGGGKQELPLTKFTPSLDLIETENEFELDVDLPGFTPEEVKVELKNGDLWISGNHDEVKEESEKTYHRVERRHGEFRRIVPLPSSIDDEKVEANFENGVLKIHLAKSDEAQVKKIPVKP